MCYLAQCLLFIIFLNSEVNSARILGVFAIPSKSHQVVFRTYTQELAKRGHELVIITPDPLSKATRDGSAYNVTEIDVSFSYDKMKEIFKNSSCILKRGVIMNVDAILEHNFYMNVLEIIAEQFNHPLVRNLLKDKTQKFDLIVVEGFFEYQLIFSEYFKAPVILFPSHMGLPHQYEMMGAASRHPKLYPNLHRMNFGKLNFWQMAYELYYEYKLYCLFQQIEKTQDKLLKINFGHEAPTSKELVKKVDILFLNAHSMIANNRPVPPNVIYLGATHLEPAKELLGDLRHFLDTAKHGVIYASFGSNVRPSMMEEDLLDAILQAFEALPYNVLWRFDGDSLENVPKNVKWQKWYPQRDLLNHPNIKAFVTQCGMQSTNEAIDAEVPLVGIPMMAEQWYNAQKYVDFGIGVKLDSLTLTADDLVNGVKTVARNMSYKTNIKRLKAILNDEPQTPLQRAVWWTEYVIRHGGAKHLRSPATNMPFHQYYMLDVILTVLAVFSLSLLFVILVFSFLIKILVKSFKWETKIKKK